MKKPLIVKIGETGPKELLGGKGHYLSKMARDGLPVPPGFIITTEGYRQWAKNGNRINGELGKGILKHIDDLEEKTERTFGAGPSPLLVSVRSGAPKSMPGMMQTFLNVGANPETCGVLSREYNNAEFARDTFMTFMEGYAPTVHGENTESIEKAMKDIKKPRFMKKVQEHPDYLNYLYNYFNKVINYARSGVTGGEINSDITKKAPYSPLKLRNAFYAMAEGIPITGARVEETDLYEGDIYRSGNIESVDETGFNMIWDDGSRGHFHSEDMWNKNRYLNISPQAKIDARSYLEDAASVGFFEVDVERLFENKPSLNEDSRTQLLKSVNAVLSSWDSETAQSYRQLNGIPHDLGTAVTVQQMVFGNIGKQSGSAVLFSSNPMTGEMKVTGEYLTGSQGEAIVSSSETGTPFDNLKESQPGVHEKLVSLAQGREDQEGEVQELEVTWEGPERIYVLQSRNSVMSPKGRIGHLVNAYEAGKKSAVQVIEEAKMSDLELLANQEELELPEKPTVLTKGIPNGQGAVSGKLRFMNSEDLKGKPILYSKSLDTSLIEKMKHAGGIITKQGGAAAHASVVAMSMGIPLISGCSNLKKDFGLIYSGRGEVCCYFDNHLTMDSDSGIVYLGEIPKKKGRDHPNLQKIVSIAQETLGDRPLLHELQHLDDVAKLEKDSKQDVVYFIDGDCFLASGLADAPERRSSEIPVADIRKQAESVYESLQKWGGAFLGVNGIFDRAYDGEGLDPHSYESVFINAYADAAGSDVNVVLSSDRNYESPLGGNVKLVGLRDETSPVKNHVLVQPWAVEESFIRAAKEVGC